MRCSRPLRWIALLLAATLSALAGCSAGRLEFASLDVRSIDPPAPRVLRLAVDSALWSGSDDRVHVALSHSAAAVPLLPIRRDVRLSLRLDRLPAGQARNYTLAPDDVRGLLREGPTESRLTGSGGILALYREPGDVLRGTLRIIANRQVKSLIGGWQRGARVLVIGEFRATRDDAAESRIRAETESLGFDRPSPAPTTRSSSTTRTSSTTRPTATRPFEIAPAPGPDAIGAP